MEIKKENEERKRTIYQSKPKGVSAMGIVNHSGNRGDEGLISVRFIMEKLNDFC